MEFALVANVVFILMFAVFEIGRAYFVYASLDEVTRRGARVAVVCPVNDPAIGRMAIFNTSGNAGPSSLVSGLTPAHIAVEYLDQNNTVVGNPADAAGFVQIRYVRVRVSGSASRRRSPARRRLPAPDAGPVRFGDHQFLYAGILSGAAAGESWHSQGREYHAMLNLESKKCAS